MPAAKTTARIERMSQRAAALLQRHPALLGRIHSRYARILNIETPDGELLTLQGPGLLQAPCAASLGVRINSLPARLSPGDGVAQTLQTPAALYLTSAGATLWDGHLAPLPNLSRTVLHDAAASLAQWLKQCVPDQGIVPVLDAFNGANSLLHRRFCDALASLFASRSISAADIEAMAAQVIGLGGGLTPSGDDLLVGFWLSGASQAERPSISPPGRADHGFERRVSTLRPGQAFFRTRGAFDARTLWRRNRRLARLRRRPRPHRP